MKEELQKILDNYDDKLEHYEKKVVDLQTKMKFCKEHNFEYEFNITSIKYEQLFDVVRLWREMHKEIQELDFDYYSE